MTDPGVHDADPGVHDADPGVHDADPGVHDADPGVHDADLAVHDGPIRAFTMDRFSHIVRTTAILIESIEHNRVEVHIEWHTERPMLSWNFRDTLLRMQPEQNAEQQPLEPPVHACHSSRAAADRPARDRPRGRAMTHLRDLCGAVDRIAQPVLSGLMRAADPSHYNLRFELDIPLVRDSSRTPSEIAIEHHHVTLVRLGEEDDEMVAHAELFRICPCSEDVLLAANEFGYPFLDDVCAEALDDDGSISDDLDEAFPHDAVTETYVLTEIEFAASDEEEDPLLRVLFVRAILDHISRGFEVLFVEDDPDQLPLWEKTIGARRFRDFIVAAGGRRLPDLRTLLDTSMHH